jgi:hypothetical protein
MDTQQMMELLLKEIRAGQEKADANQAKTEAGHKELLAKLEADRQASWKTWREELAAMRDKRMEVDREAAREEVEPEQDIKMMACQEMEVSQEKEKPTSVDTKPEAAQEEVPEEDAEVMPVGEPKKRKRHRDRKLATERCHHKPKNSTWENCGPQEK